MCILKAIKDVNTHGVLDGEKIHNCFAEFYQVGSGVSVEQYKKLDMRP